MEEKADHKIWIITDERDGNNSQCYGVAHKLGGNVTEIKACDISSPYKAQEFVKTQLMNATPSEPTVVISASPNTIHVARWIKEEAKGRVHSVKLGTDALTRSDYRNYDLVVDHAKAYGDNPPKNMIRTIGVAHKVTPELIADEVQNWQNKFSLPASKKIVSVLVGGDTSDVNRFTPAAAKAFGETLRTFAKNNNITLIVSNSRRTSATATAALFESLKDVVPPENFYDRHKGGENPYFAMLGIADGFITTGDSLSMMCETCSTGKPVYIAPMAGIEWTHTGLQNDLICTNRARPFKPDGIFEHWSYQPLDTAGQIAETISDALDEKKSLPKVTER